MKENNRELSRWTRLAQGLALTTILVGPGATQEPATRPAPPIQDPGKEPAIPKELADLALRARSALYTHPEKDLEITGFGAHLMILMRGQQTFEVEARQDFAFPRSIRTEIRERGLKLLRGHDGRDYWQARPGRPLLDLRAREYQKDRARVREELRLAGQVIRLFQVDRLLGSLEKPAPLGQERAAVLHGERLMERLCVVAEGDLDEFPFYSVRDRHGEPYHGPARIRIWLDHETAEPKQVQAWPTFARTRDSIRIHGEWIQLGEFRTDPSGRLRVPTLFRLRALSPRTDQLTTLLEVDLKDLKINPDFPEGHFSRSAGRVYAGGTE